MSNVIGFLEAMGQDATLRDASQSDVQSAMASAQIEPEFLAAILSKDQQRLEGILGATANVCCEYAPGKEEEDEPAQDDDEIKSQSLVYGIASAA